MTRQPHDQLAKQYLEDRELIMNLSPAYLQWREEAVQEGR